MALRDEREQTGLSLLFIQSVWRGIQHIVRKGLGIVCGDGVDSRINQHAKRKAIHKNDPNQT